MRLTFAYTCATDRRARNGAPVWGTAVLDTADPMYGSSITLIQPQMVRAEDAFYLWDDGATVVPMRVVRWEGAAPGAADRVVLANAAPVASVPAGEPVAVDYGARRVYHLKVRAQDSTTENV